MGIGFLSAVLWDTHQYILKGIAMQPDLSWNRSHNPGHGSPTVYPPGHDVPPMSYSLRDCEGVIQLDNVFAWWWSVSVKMQRHILAGKFLPISRQCQYYQIVSISSRKTCFSAAQEVIACLNLLFPHEGIKIHVHSQNKNVIMMPILCHYMHLSPQHGWLMKIPWVWINPAKTWCIQKAHIINML